MNSNHEIEKKNTFREIFEENIHSLNLSSDRLLDDKRKYFYLCVNVFVLIFTSFAGFFINFTDIDHGNELIALKKNEYEIKNIKRNGNFSHTNRFGRCIVFIVCVIDIKLLCIFYLFLSFFLLRSISNLKILICIYILLFCFGLFLSRQ